MSGGSMIECEDTISRGDALKALDYDIKSFEFKSGIGRHMNEIADLLNTIYEIQSDNIKALPPVQPKSKTETITEFADRCRECGKQKKGRWIKITPSGIYMCSECEQNVLTGDIDAYHYCHHCGVKMINEDENHENQNES